ncbi:MAG: shikimate dehydrogenase [Cytophagales bacterium]|nr:shikimate dehydrogenase [Cytophagales bacterium]
MEKFGLIGYPLGHSYSKKFFTEKFEKLGLTNHKYDLFEMEYLKEFPAMWLNNDLHGVNVTIPHKEHVMGFLDYLDSSAQKVGAVNLVKREQGKLKGYNTDYLSFKETLDAWLPHKNLSALILGSGGASKAVQVGLDELDIDCDVVSRKKTSGDYTYLNLKKDPEIIGANQLIINATPMGTYPEVDDRPDIPYDQLTNKHFLYDLVYNPEETQFMKSGLAQGATVKNGIEMLHLQADKSWDIWYKQ